MVLDHVVLEYLIHKLVRKAINVAMLRTCRSILVDVLAAFMACLVFLSSFHNEAAERCAELAMRAVQSRYYAFRSRIDVKGCSGETWWILCYVHEM